MENEDFEYVSKSQIKREMHQLQKLGEKLVDLSVSQLKSIDMPKELLDAVIDAKNTDSFIAGRRSLQYIGALMREADPEPIREALDKISRGIALKPKAEDPEKVLMNQLLSEGKEAFSRLLEKYPDLDRQHVNQLIRLASKEKKAGKKEKHRNALLRFLKQLEEE